MARHLFRIGRWSFRHRRIVVSVWLGLLVAVGIGATTLSGDTSDEFSIPGIESTEAFDLIKERTPEAAPDGATARVVFRAPGGERLDDPANERLVLDTVDALTTDNVVSAVDPFTAGAISDDGRTGYATVSYAVNSIELTAADKEALESAPDAARGAGLQVAIGGDAVQEVPHGGTAELIGIGVAIIVLVLTFGSLLTAGMPLLTALVGVGIGVAGITTLTGFMDLGATTPILATMLGLAVGIDYALFIVSRYRHEVASGRPLEEAAGHAVGTAGSAVVFAGLTVMAALAGLSVVGISFLTEMGLAASATVGIAVLIALTMLPAVFGFAGTRIRRDRLPGVKARDPEAKDVRTLGRRWADLITRRKGVTFGAGLAVAAVLAIPVASLQLALPDDGSASDGSGPRVAYDLIADNFGAGTNGPLLVVVDVAGAADPGAAVDRAVAAVSGVEEDVAQVIAPAPPADATPEELADFQQQFADAQYATITVIPESGPSDAATQQLVDDLRVALADLPDQTGARALVTGQTALGVDISESLGSALPKYLLVVVGFALVLLTVVFRSILVPLKAVGGFLISVGVALGATVAVFQWGWFADLIGVDNPGPVLFMLPLLLTGILFGLAMDYEVFLVSRMREEYVHGAEATEAVVTGFQHGARVVTAAAAIMVGVFGGFALGDDVIIKSIGFGLAVGVLADAFLVRMTLVPAFMALVGDRMWWLPTSLERALPNLDIEGEALARDDRELVGAGR
ncbi:Tat pathway signal sequence domain protein [Aeromicrobium marinum DSM 15272]|uniref:Tat pathway signal sequence domain protein n=1 Tax=Aeromicrobium marinum DSM 15272 TaxID=585531 RepID=E2SF82_9ACTN|nr:MMPL family transporter [Aeromicrobium marinum]EFQ82167.1 Tat pathway signal sequence domain protein [Aeromicrobium marinum DSM 15272]